MSQISFSPFANFNSAVAWGLWVSIYVWFVGISAGAFLLIGIGRLRNDPCLKKIARPGLALSLAALMAGLLSIQIDLGHIERFYKLFLSPNPSSIMAWMVWLYSIYFVILAAMLVFARKEMPRPLILFSVVFAFAVITVESLLFALPPGKAWHSPVFPLHFFTTSLVSAITALILMAGKIYSASEKNDMLKGLAKTAIPLVAINIVVGILEMVFSGGAGHLTSWVVLLVDILVLALLAKSSPSLTVLAGLIGLVNVLFSKYISLISAQVQEPFKGFAGAYIEPRLGYSYSPTVFEYLVSVALVMLAIVLFYFLHNVSMAIRED